MVHNKIVTFINAAATSEQLQGEGQAPTPAQHNAAMAKMEEGS